MAKQSQDLNDEETRIIEEMVFKGASSEEIDAKLDEIYSKQNQSSSQNQYGQHQETGMSAEEMEDLLKSLANYDPDAVFQEKPAKPSFFKAPKTMRKFKPSFDLKSDRKYVLNGQEAFVKKLNLRDVIRLSTKLPEYARYIGFNSPRMLVDEITGKYRLTETILTLLERALSEWDYELDRPTDFAHSVLEEVAYMLNIKAQDDIAAVDYLLSSDPEEVFDAMRLVVEYNQGFFIKAWNVLGPIKEIWSLTSGMITSKIKNLRILQNQQNEETNLNQTNESE